MKNWILILISTLCSLCLSQCDNKTSNNNVYEIESVNPLDSNYNDFLFLDNVLKDVDIVFIGEQTHGEGTVTKAKTRLIKYLNSNLGFNTLVFEASFYDTYMAGAFIKSMQNKDIILKSAIPPMWYNTKEFEEIRNILKEEVTSDSLKLYGIDCQTRSLARNTLFNYLGKKLIKNGNQIDSSSLILLNKYIWSTPNKNGSYFDNNADSVNVFKYLDNLIEESKNIKSKPVGFWTQSLINLRTNLLINIIKFNDDGPIYYRNNIRDKIMAENILWIIGNRNKGDKIIVWSASMHNARNIRLIEEVSDTSFYNNYIPMGQIVYNNIGNKMYSIAFTSSTGLYQVPYMMNEPVAITSKQVNSIESYFQNNSIEYGFVNLRGTETNGFFWENIYSNPHGHKNVKAVWPKIHDGIFYIDSIQPPTLSK